MLNKSIMKEEAFSIPDVFRDVIYRAVEERAQLLRVANSRYKVVKLEDGNSFKLVRELSYNHLVTYDLLEGDFRYDDLVFVGDLLNIILKQYGLEMHDDPKLLYTLATLFRKGSRYTVEQIDDTKFGEYLRDLFNDPRHE